MRKLIILTIVFNMSVIPDLFGFDVFKSYTSKPNNALRLGKTKLFNQVYFESGVKFSNNSDTIGNLHSGLLGFQHQVIKKVSVFHSFNFLSQDNYWGNVNQGSYYANVEYKLNNRLKLNLVGSYLNNKTRIPGKEIYKNDNFIGLISGTYNYGNFYLKPLLAISDLNVLRINSESSIVSEKETQTQSGMEVYYDIKNNDKLVFGIGVYHFTNAGEASTLVKPYVSYTINDELFFSFDYLYAYANNFSDQNGYVIYNSIDKTIDRYNANLRYEFANNLFLFGVYQFEQKQYYFSKTTYQFNSLFLGIKYNL